MSLLNIITAFVEDCVILVSVTLPFKYCPDVVSVEMSPGKYTAINSKVILLLLKAIMITLLIVRTFSLVYEQNISVPFSPSIPNMLPFISTDNAFASAMKYR